MSAASANYDQAKPNKIIFNNIKNTKLYLPVFTLSATDNQKLLNGFERLMYWNQCKAKCESKSTANGYRYFIKSDFVGVNKLFVLVYFNGNNDVKWYKARKY